MEFYGMIGNSEIFHSYVSFTRGYLVVSGSQRWRFPGNPHVQNMQCEHRRSGHQPGAAASTPALQALEGNLAADLSLKIIGILKDISIWIVYTDTTMDLNQKNMDMIIDVKMMPSPLPVVTVTANSQSQHD
jgi:hypothetical protein